MLFRTVYGPELPAIHALLVERGAVGRPDLNNMFVQGLVSGTEVANFEEALALLIDTGLVRWTGAEPHYLAGTPIADFRLSLLASLQRFSTNQDSSGHLLDPWFMGVLNECFVRPNRVFLNRLHSAFNSLELPVPCSEEKVNAWRRIMEYLGCGYRVLSGFMACYHPDLLMDICKRWGKHGPVEGLLQFAEGFIPVLTETGEMSKAVEWPLMELERRGHVSLSARGDYPGRSFMGPRRIKWITVEG